MTIRTLIVDDEKLAIQGLQLRLEPYADVEVIGTCANGREAIRAIKTEKPDLVFLDIQMPGFDGFSVVKGVMDIDPPLFVFVTAYEEHAIRAFEANAVNYLMKPVDEDKLADTLDRVRTLEEIVSGSVARPRFAASVLAAFGASALLLAVIGVYGVLSYAMERRRRELAVRLALGARHGQVRALVIRSGLTLAGAGVAAGLLAAVIGKQIIAGLLFQVSPTDGLTLAAVAIALLGAAMLASWIPARRATTASPAEVLRGE